ncbi:hypothetical protein [Lactococcus lactis]|uniref:hypothetical protein n=1 Tax=Lactococcus lactis TaxID=1358 RepID=UPI0022E2C39F|nr:hypothetical protein [Lactococcus lactis]
MVYKSFKVNLEKEKNEKNDSEYDDAMNSYGIFMAIEQFNMEFGIVVLDGEAEGFKKIGVGIDNLELKIKKMHFIFDDDRFKNLYSFMDSYVDIQKNMTTHRMAIKGIEQTGIKDEKKSTIWDSVKIKAEKELFSALELADKYIKLVETE